MSQSQGDVTMLLKGLSDGNPNLINDLMPMVYSALHQMAEGQLRSERADHTLNATALIHEAYLKLIGQENVNWQNRAHFMAISAISMRRILTNYARARLAKKRGGGEAVATFSDEFHAGEMQAQELVDLDEALGRLAEMDERQAKVVEYRFFGGLKYEEIAEVLKMSIPTVRRDWRLAKAWLATELTEDR